MCWPLHFRPLVNYKLLTTLNDFIDTFFFPDEKTHFRILISLEPCCSFHSLTLKGSHSSGIVALHIILQCSCPNCSNADAVNDLVRSHEGGLSVRIQKEDLEEGPGSCLQPDSTPGTATIWGVNQQIEDLSLCAALLSSF